MSDATDTTMAPDNDLRQGVTAPVHEVLDFLDRSRPGWAQLDLERLKAEMDLAADVAILDVNLAKRSVRRMAALGLYLFERVSA